MVNVCCVEGCIQTKDVIYFNVPNSRTLRKKWLEAFKPNCRVTNHSVVCSKHFLEGQYETVRGKKRLKAKVVPSVFDDINKQEIPKKSPEKHVTNKSKTKERERNRRKREKEPKKKKRTEDSVESVQNGEHVDSIVKRTEPTISTDNESNKDIEDIITNYHIQVPTNRKVIEHHGDIDLMKNGEAGEGGEIVGSIGNFHMKQANSLNEEEQVQGRMEVQEIEENRQTDLNIIDVDNLKEPVFIEVSVDKGENNNQDCVMLLESVQCEVDPTSLMLEDPEPDPDPSPDPASEDDDVVDLGEKKEDPISLLTSSDEDEVIIEEPKIDTVEVSDETDEDDVPLVKLVENPTRTNRRTRRASKESTEKILWGLYEYYCVECHYRTTSKTEFKRHRVEHAVVLQVCQACGFTTSSRAQFVRHKRKHAEDRKFKCHLCDFKARHNMSLTYHMRTHDRVGYAPVGSGAGDGLKCPKCGFVSDVRVDTLKHIRLCAGGGGKYACGECSYGSSRRADLKRHKMRRHRGRDLDGDEDYVPPAWSG